MRLEPVEDVLHDAAEVEGVVEDVFRAEFPPRDLLARVRGGGDDYAVLRKILSQGLDERLGRERLADADRVHPDFAAPAEVAQAAKKRKTQDSRGFHGACNDTWLTALHATPANLIP